MAMVNQGLLLLVPIRRKAVSSHNAAHLLLIRVQKLINPIFAAHW